MFGSRRDLPVGLQRKMFEQAPKHFEFERLSHGRHVIFEHSGLTEFNVSIENSQEPQKSKLKAAIARGDLQVANLDLVEQLSQTHSRFHAVLYDAGVRVPPAVIRLGDVPVIIGQPLPVESRLWVKKVSFDKEGKYFGHRGAGVSMIVPRNRNDILPSHDHEFFQQFVVPPDNRVRDIRVYVVGSKIIPGYVRTAEKPLTRGNYSGLYPPSREQFVTAEHPGDVTPLEGELAQKVAAEARKVHKAFIDRLRRTKPEWKKQAVFGFGSMDFLLDANGDPIICEFDTGPEVRDIGKLHDNLANEIAAHLVKKAGKNGIVHVIGNRHDSFIEKILQHLRRRIRDSQISQKQPLHHVVLGS